MAYRLRWNERPRILPALSRALVSRSGPSHDGKRRLFVIDFVGGVRTVEDLKLEAGTSAGRISNANLQPNPSTRGVRASFELAPGDATIAELRVRLLRGSRPASETWLYRWTGT